MGGFTYNNIHSSTYHVEYIPDADDRWFQGADFDIYETNVAWKHGGYYYGNKAKIREFTMKCWFDQITKKQREQIRKWLGRDTSGTLILDDMPFVYWKVRPAKVIPGKLYNDHQDFTMNHVYSGTFTLVLHAYDPFGYLTRKYNTQSDDDNANDYCDLLPQSEMPAAPSTSSYSFNVYNPGTEPCGLRIKIGGTATKTFRFFNSTNKTRCELNGLPSSLVVDIRGDTGRITLHTANSELNEEENWSYHNGGYIILSPGTNSIVIEEKNTSNAWVTPTGLTISSIAIDYAPRIL
jgi:phage-related protein